METVFAKRYWPYDEVTISGSSSLGHYLFATPWIQVGIEVEQEDIARTDSVISKIRKSALESVDLEDVSWLFSSLSQHSLAYILPRSEIRGNADRHVQFDLPAPQVLLKETSDWEWDAQAALNFSAIPGGHDPISVFSVIRRFHLLESVESNKTQELSIFIRGLQSDRARCRDALMRVVRQNHYVTQKCGAALRPALEIAQSASDGVKKFILSESGHDVLLERALKGMGIPYPEDISIIEPVRSMMDLFTCIAERNFLAFSSVVDMFERSSHLKKDPLASLLEESGFFESARQIELHREINDSGKHENIALSFLENMAPVSTAYVTEAMHLTELMTKLLHRISSTLLKDLQS